MISQPEVQIGVMAILALLFTEIIVVRLDVFWKMRRYICLLLSSILGVAVSLLVIDQPLWLVILVSYLSLIHLILILRLAGDKIEQYKSRRLSKRSFVLTNALTLSIYFFVSIKNFQVWAELGVTAILLLTLYAVVTKMKKSKPRIAKLNQSLDQLPTVTLAIPSRNESYDLVQALDQALKSNYPKLEILVLDDCSGVGVNEIIKNFAHKGVIFLRGTPPAKHWLAKNWAYQQLLHNANGEYLIYAGVDVRMGINSIEQIIATTQSGGYNMVSVLPLRIWQKTDWYLLLQSLRYHRIFSGLNHIRNMPPPLSSCYIVKRDILVKAGGFNTCRNSIYPERVIAKVLSSYNFIVSDRDLGVDSVKSFRGQFNTAVRTYYPLAQMQPEKIALRTIILLYALWLVSVGLTALIIHGNYMNLGLVVLILGFLVHLIVGYAVGTRNIFVWTCQLPLLILAEIVVMHYSMFKYEFSDVLWKGRNVCIPLLRYEHRLPETTST